MIKTKFSFFQVQIKGVIRLEGQGGMPMTANDDIPTPHESGFLHIYSAFC
ncbi:hypothetical protein C8R28_103736 [Nitrosomonas ureae]|uniref:Uncharacterized protein n=1 Tax=Nitrosomonas ureae TaxID=44577 RepID=A0A2T5I9W7_9PROT|nr:hypothetical protein C8R28_103736 [Nitrosomonas ureae]